MGDLVAITSFKGVGSTFVDWSILFLSGQDQHWYHRQQAMVAVPRDPINSHNGVVNAHRHLKNHPMGSIETAAMLPDLQRQGAAVETVYPGAQYLDLCYQQLGIDLDQAQSNADLNQRVLSYWTNDYQRVLEHCLDLAVPLIFIDADPAPMGYYWRTRQLERLLLKDARPTDHAHWSQEKDGFYYADSQAAWQQLGLTEVWDQREQMALDYRPFSRDWFPKFGLTRPHLYINCQDLWNLAPDVLRHCFDHLSLTLDESRWHHWIKVANTWQQNQHRLLCFYHSLDHIVACTLNGWYYPLPRLELWQEAIIQHCLIYRHGCNLKTWQLTQFPDNTQDLHKLVVPNTHPVSQIY